MQLNRSVTAIVTGGASGLGEATARELAGAGVRVALFDLNKDRGNKVASEIDGVFCEVNVANEQSVIDGFAKARAALGQERILVNCAGTGIAVKTALAQKRHQRGGRSPHRSVRSHHSDQSRRDLSLPLESGRRHADA